MSKKKELNVKAFNVVEWSERFSSVSSDIGGLTTELTVAYPDFKTDRVSDDNVKEIFNTMKYTFSKTSLAKNPKGLKTNDGMIGYWLFTGGKWNSVSKTEFNLTATDDTRLKGTSINLSNDEYGAYMYATKPAFRSHLEKKDITMYDKVISTIDWLKSSIRSKVSLLDAGLDVDKTQAKAGRRKLSKAQSMLDRLSVWEGKNGAGLQKAIDNGDALGLAWVEFKPKYKEFKEFFKAVVKRENG
tara:strand:+ start:91 stop:819 length:729 start_codon:yes stop_codon:yes gene_type:complete